MQAREALSAAQLQRRVELGESVRDWLEKSQRSLRELVWELDRFEPLVSVSVESRRSALERALGDLEREERSMQLQDWRDACALQRELLQVQLERDSLLHSIGVSRKYA